MTAQTKPLKSHWILLALFSGVFAALNGLFAKLYNTYLPHPSQQARKYTNQLTPPAQPPTKQPQPSSRCQTTGFWNCLFEAYALPPYTIHACVRQEP